MSNNNKGQEKFKNLMNKPKPEGSVHDQFFGPIEKKDDKDNVNPSDNPNTDHNENLPDNIEVSVTSIPVAKKKRNIRDTHKTKAFYIRNDIAKLIEKDIKHSSRGDMTKIVNALFEEYYRSQGKLK